jgi:hypothetical protein
MRQINFDKNKKELVFPTTKYKDSKLIDIAYFCKKENKRLVLIIPTIKSYSPEINKCFTILGDDLLIYELAMGMQVVLTSRAKKYIEYINTAELYEEN